MSIETCTQECAAGSVLLAQTCIQETAAGSVLLAPTCTQETAPGSVLLAQTCTQETAAGSGSVLLAQLSQERKGEREIKKYSELLGYWALPIFWYPTEHGVSETESLCNHKVRE
jgi:hypothetical protein